MQVRIAKQMVTAVAIVLNTVKNETLFEFLTTYILYDILYRMSSIIFG